MASADSGHGLASNAEASEESEHKSCCESVSDFSHCQLASGGSHNPPPPKSRSRQIALDYNIVHGAELAETMVDIPKDGSYQQAQRNHIRSLLEDSANETLAADSEALWEWCDTIL
jgi:hypothetical protein